MTGSQGQTKRVARTHSMDDVPIRKPAADGISLGQLETMFLARVDGKRSIGDIGGLLELSIAEASRMVGRLVELGAIDVEEHDPPTTRRPE
ncbi:MAG: hypothetical protein ACXVEF_05485 [Polyangiales bacterium]